MKINYVRKTSKYEILHKSPLNHKYNVSGNCNNLLPSQSRIGFTLIYQKHTS